MRYEIITNEDNKIALVVNSEFYGTYNSLESVFVTIEDIHTIYPDESPQIEINEDKEDESGKLFEL